MSKMSSSSEESSSKPHSPSVAAAAATEAVVVEDVHVAGSCAAMCSCCTTAGGLSATAWAAGSGGAGQLEPGMLPITNEAEDVDAEAQPELLLRLLRPSSSVDAVEHEDPAPFGALPSSATLVRRAAAGSCSTASSARWAGIHGCRANWPGQPNSRSHCSRARDAPAPVPPAASLWTAGGSADAEGEASDLLPSIGACAPSKESGGDVLLIFSSVEQCLLRGKAFCGRVGTIPPKHRRLGAEGWRLDVGGAITRSVDLVCFAGTSISETFRGSIAGHGFGRPRRRSRPCGRSAHLATGTMWLATASLALYMPRIFAFSVRCKFITCNHSATAPAASSRTACIAMVSAWRANWRRNRCRTAG